MSRLSVNKKCVLTVAATGLVWVAAAAVLCALPVGDALGFLAFSALCAALPGTATVKLLGLKLTPLAAFCASYGLGIGVNVAVYFCFAPFGHTELIPYGLCAVAVLSAGAHFALRRRPFAAKSDSGELRIALIAAGIAAVVVFVSMPMCYLAPDISGARYYFHDVINSVGITASAAKGFPFEFLEMTGTPYYYHAFFFAYAANLELTLGITAFEAMTQLTLITITPFLICCTALLAHRVLSTRAGVWAATVFGALLPAGYTMWHYVYRDTLGYVLGMAYGLLAVYFFVVSHSASPTLPDRHFAAYVLFLALAVGTKGPAAVAFVFGICFVLLVEIIRDRNMWGFVKGAIIAVVFFGLYFVLYRTGAGESMSFSLAYSANRTDFGSATLSVLPVWLATFINCVVYSLGTWPLITLGFVSSIVLLKKRAAGDGAFAWYNIGSVAFGFVIINLFKQMGSSELYFLMASFQTATMAFVAAGEYFAAKFSAKPKAVKSVSAAAVCALLATALIAGRGFYLKDLKTAVTYSRFSSTTTSDRQAVADDLEIKVDHIITPDEYEGYMWLRENTPSDAVIGDCRYQNRYFFCGCALSERGFFLEGTGFVTMERTNLNEAEFERRENVLMFFYSTEDESFLPLFASNGIDYVIINEYYNPGFVLSDTYAELCFENDGMRIYRITYEVPDDEEF